MYFQGGAPLADVDTEFSGNPPRGYPTRSEVRGGVIRQAGSLFFQTWQTVVQAVLGILVMHAFRQIRNKDIPDAGQWMRPSSRIFGSRNESMIWAGYCVSGAEDNRAVFFPAGQIVEQSRRVGVQADVTMDLAFLDVPETTGMDEVRRRTRGSAVTA